VPRTRDHAQSPPVGDHREGHGADRGGVELPAAIGALPPDPLEPPPLRAGQPDQARTRLAGLPTALGRWGSGQVQRFRSRGSAPWCGREEAGAELPSRERSGRHQIRRRRGRRSRTAGQAGHLGVQRREGGRRLANELEARAPGTAHAQPPGLANLDGPPRPRGASRPHGSRRSRPPRFPTTPPGPRPDRQLETPGPSSPGSFRSGPRGTGWHVRARRTCEPWSSKSGSARECPCRRPAPLDRLTTDLRVLDSWFPPPLTGMKSLPRVKSPILRDCPSLPTSADTPGTLTRENPSRNTPLCPKRPHPENPATACIPQRSQPASGSSSSLPPPPPYVRAEARDSPGSCRPGLTVGLRGRRRTVLPFTSPCCV